MKDEIGRTYRTHGYKRNIHQVLVRNCKGKDHLQDVGEDGTTVLK